MDLELILREVDSTERRLASQLDLVSNNEAVLQKARETGSFALERICKVRSKRLADNLADTRKVLAELKALLPPPPMELPLEAPSSKPPAKGGSHSSRT